MAISTQQIMYCAHEVELTERLFTKPRTKELTFDIRSKYLHFRRSQRHISDMYQLSCI